MGADAAYAAHGVHDIVDAVVALVRVNKYWFLQKGSMTARQYAFGVAMTMMLSIVFYSWLLHSLLNFPLPWLLFTMVAASVVLAILGFTGYRMWLSRSSNPTLNDPDSARATLIRLVALMTIVSLPAWSALYASARGSGRAASMLALLAAVIALYGATKWSRSSAAVNVHAVPSDHESRLPAPDPADAAQASLIALMPLLTFFIAFVAWQYRDFIAASILFVASCVALVWAWRRVRVLLHLN